MVEAVRSSGEDALRDEAFGGHCCCCCVTEFYFGVQGLVLIYYIDRDCGIWRKRIFVQED